MFIVIEGLDGAGKSTQVKLIKEQFNKKGIETEYVHFPRYDAPVYGDLIAKFLRGDLGELDNVSPYLVGLIYAGDRADGSEMIKRWLAEGKAVIVDRYVYSNIAYQCAKCNSSSESDELRNWIFNLEYSKNNIQKPDLTLFLDVPFQFTKSNLQEVRAGDDRDYLNGKQDIHEASLTFQERVREVYIQQEKLDDTFKVIDCSDADGAMLPPADIYARIENVLSSTI